MAKLIYDGIMSLDGYIEDANGSFEWSVPTKEVHLFVNDLQRPVGTYLYGRRMYEVMSYWETAHAEQGQPDYVLEFAEIWQAADKIVYSQTLESVSTARTRLEPKFDVAAVEAMKAADASDITIAGPSLASTAIRAGLVDEFRMFVSPVVVGGGKAYLPDGVRLELDLLEERRFDNGVVFLRYASTGSGK
jgi:dihydrofolate reductase